MSSENPSTHDRILEITWAFFEERGVSFTIEDVAQAAGVSRQAVYLHFGSRAGLFVATVRHQDEQQAVSARFRAARDRASSGEALEAWLQVWFDYLPPITRAAEGLLSAAQGDEDARAALSDRWRSQRQGISHFLLRLETDGVLNRIWTIDQATALLWSLIHVTAWNQLVGECGWTPQQFIESRLEIVRRTLLVEAGAGSR